MINKDSKENKNNVPNDTSNVEVSAHLIIKDKDTGKIIVNKRG